jgi:hypothetical protein
LIFVEESLEGGYDLGSGVRVGEAGLRHCLTRCEHLVEEVLRVAPGTAGERGPQLAKVGRDACRNRIGRAAALAIIFWVAYLGVRAAGSRVRFKIG